MPGTCLVMFGEGAIFSRRGAAGGWYVNCPFPRWREFLAGDDPKEEVVRRQDWVVGDERFRVRMHQRQPRPAPRRPGRLAGRYFFRNRIWRLDIRKLSPFSILEVW